MFEGVVNHACLSYKKVDFLEIYVWDVEPCLCGVWEGQISCVALFLFWRLFRENVVLEVSSCIAIYFSHRGTSNNCLKNQRGPKLGSLQTFNACLMMFSHKFWLQCNIRVRD